MSYTAVRDFLHVVRNVLQTKLKNIIVRGNGNQYLSF
jgi:hypothetical protein